MTRAPVELLFIGFDDVSPDTARALVDRMDAANHVRVVSATVAHRDGDGVVTTDDWTRSRDLQDVAADLAARDFLGIDAGIGARLADVLDPGQSILLLVVRHLWAESMCADMLAVGGHSLAAHIVPAEHLIAAEDRLDPQGGS